MRKFRLITVFWLRLFQCFRCHACAVVIKVRVAGGYRYLFAHHRNNVQSSTWISYTKLLRITRVKNVLNQSARLFTFLFSTNEGAGNRKLSTKRARKYCRLLRLLCHSIFILPWEFLNFDLERKISMLEIFSCVANTNLVTYK